MVDYPVIKAVHVTCVAVALTRKVLIVW